ncbi:MAG: hypothetical protein RJA99_3244 [Pseudomonadota bacterium]|jgi:glycosyltransferase involved in cell wall biosynthesis
MTPNATAAADDPTRTGPAPRPPTAAAPTRVAVLLPCFNEALSIAAVVADFRRVLPDATVYVYDNNSVDGTAAVAASAGAVVRAEPWPGKGNVVRRMFAEIDADVYLIADGDGTYDAEAAPLLVRTLVERRLDMVVGTRRDVYEDAHRPGHGFGNRLFNGLYRRLFGRLFTDIFSGYRAFSRRYVKSFPAVSAGFEIETEMSVHASQLRLPIGEVETRYGRRQPGSSSKLRTFRDAGRILATLLVLYKELRPIRFFGSIAVALTAGSLVLATPLLFTWLETGLVPRLPTAVLATGLILLAAISLTCGLVLDSVARGRLEQKRIWYVSAASDSPAR